MIDSQHTTPLHSYSQDGEEHVSYYSVDDHGSEQPIDWSFHVTRSDIRPIPEEKWYELTAKVFDKDTVQTTWMANNKLPDYKGKGISEALIPEIARLLEKNIISSPPYDDAGNRRSPYATIIWERLVAAGIANQRGDRYIVPYSVAASAPRRRT